MVCGPQVDTWYPYLLQKPLVSNQKRGRDQLLAVKVLKMMCVSGAERVLTFTEPIETQSIPSEASALDSLLGVGSSKRH